MMSVYESREQIKNRILEDAAREWGYRNKMDIDLQKFDPLVDLLVGACSSELEKISNDIANSRNRVFEHLVHILTPDEMTAIQPAHAVLHTMPVEPSHRTSIYDQFFYKNPDRNTDMYFSPTGAYTLHRTRVSYLAYDNKMVHFNEYNFRENFFEAKFGQYLPAQTCYIGMKVDPSIQNLEYLRFYFDWEANKNLDVILKHLSLSRWSINDRKITVKQGLVENVDMNIATEVLNEKAYEKYLHNNVLDACSGHFLTVVDNIRVSENITTYPKEFEDLYTEEDLSRLTEKVLWFRVEFPSSVEMDLATMKCQTNCIPVLNRKLHTVQQKIENELNIYPLRTEHTDFFHIDAIENKEGNKYREVPLRVVQGNQSGVYALREKGVKKFDKREAYSMLQYTLELIDDEHAIFKSLGYSSLSSDLNELEIILKRIRKNVGDQAISMNNETFIFLRPLPQDDILYIKYWSTDGEQANRIPVGSRANTQANHNYQAQLTSFMTPSKGGKNKMKTVDSIHTFKEAVMTRGRLVTMEDIKNYCISCLGHRNIKSIDVSRGIELSKNKDEGIIRTINVLVERKKQSLLSEEEWALMIQETAMKLNNRSAGVLPINIKSNIS